MAQTLASTYIEVSKPEQHVGSYDGKIIISTPLLLVSQLQGLPHLVSGTSGASSVTLSSGARMMTAATMPHQ